MKRILLASASIVAFAGAAAAEITFSGEANLGYNDTDNLNPDQQGADQDNLGFYWDASIDVTMSKALDNGLTASASFGLNVVENDLGEDVASSDYVLSLTSDTAGLYFGNTEFAAVTHWVSAGDMESDGFSEEDGETVLRGDITYGGVNASVSYAVNGEKLEQLSLGADATFGTISVAFGYQEDANPEYTGAGGDYNGNDVMGLSVGTSFGGADVRLAYAQEGGTEDRSTIAVKVSYPFGPVTIGASYAMEDDKLDATVEDFWEISADYASGPIAANVNYDSNEDWELTGSYDVGNGITAYAGVVDAGDDMYVAASVALGEGATLLVSYVDTGDTSNADDEIGPNDYQEGATVELGFSF
jgi:outer membrane protein OmpU